MTRGRFRASAAVVVVLVLSGLGWLFLAPRGATTPEGGPEPVARKPALESGEEAEARAAALPPVRPSAESAEGREPKREVVHGPPREAGIRGLCVLEDGMPLAGVLVDVTLEETPDGVILGEESKTGTDGTFDACADRQVELRHPWARVVAVEGGVLRETGKTAILKTDTATAAVKVVFRDDPGTAHVRLLDSSSLQPLTSSKGLRLTYFFGRDLTGRGVYDFPEDMGLGGWIPIREGSLPEDLDIQADPAGVVVEFAAPGYAAKRVPFPDIRGRMTVRVEPVPFCAAGSVLLHRGDPPQPMGPEAHVTAEIRRAEGDTGPPAAEIRGLPTDDGPFLLYDLPQGSWVLEVAADLGGSVVRAKKAFEYRGAPVDLGDLLLQRGAAVRARALDAEGTPMPQARVVVVREGEDPEKARELAPGVDGWVAYADLEPGASHRAVALGMPRPLEKALLASSDGSRVEVELSWPEKLVPCRITLVVDGKAVANPDGSRTIPATVHESPLPRDQGAWNADGTFAAKLVPGTYRFSAYATPEGGGDLVLFAGEVTVPSGDSFETRLELQRETR